MDIKILSEGWDENHYEYHCSDGIHESFWKTVITSSQWEAWEKVAGKEGWDTDECRECGWISPQHFQAFIKFIISLPPLIK